MSRYRITSAKTDVDREIGQRLEEAERSVKQALKACEFHDRTAEGVQEKMRTRKVGRDLKRILGAISDVRKVRSVFLIEEEKPKAPTPRLPAVGKVGTPTPASTPKRPPVSKPILSPVRHVSER